jgi:predicted RNA-binding protein YlxR (DUF448 family)
MFPEPVEGHPTTPIRTCIGCRSRAPQADLLRLVWTADGVRADPERRRPGRGAYLHATAECRDQAVRRRALGRALRRDGIGPADLATALAQAEVSAGLGSSE